MMNPPILRLCLLVPLVVGACRQHNASAPASAPIIDMHLHTLWWQPGMKEPLTGFVAPNTPEELRRRTIAELDRYHIVKAVASGDQIEPYRQALAERLLPGILIIGRPTVSPDALREMHRRGDLAVLAEFAPQYAGLAPAAPELEPYWALAAELDLPVGIHIGLGPPGASYVGYPDYRMQLSNPLQLEDVLIRYPKLRIYIMHAGWPFLDEMVGLLYAHPQVYLDVAVINWVLPEPEFHAYLRRLVDAGFANRIMFGSDNMMWTEAFGVAVDRIMSAPFLSTDQKRDILCRNAATFLRLSDATCQS
jgi:predicted TIM-barrel fold metal-dependent hydrolase